MENEIKVGEFVKDTIGQIGKIKEIDKSNLEELEFIVDIGEGRDDLFMRRIDIVNHSLNIIDLIEVGDYVNGKQVYSIGTAIGDFQVINFKDGTFDINIKSIVTHEQFEQICYRVERKSLRWN